MSYTWYCILGTLLFYLGAGLIAYLCFLIPEVNTGSSFFVKLYYRYSYFTEYLNFGSFTYYWVINLYGFIFVNIVNLQNERHNPTYDQHLNSKSFYKTMFIVSPVLYFFTPVVTMRGTNDLS
mmetsp:Transcript_432/g.405  ORF Transcript_432/g.405 Transcript_432/m.405 type:complete len:122 (+) Transcript_432:122-487(+)